MLTLKLEGQWLMGTIVRSAETSIIARSQDHPYKLELTCLGATPQRRIHAFKASCATSDQERLTPLHEAAEAGDPQIIRLLLAEGHTMDRLTFMGQSTLFLAT